MLRKRFKQTPAIVLVIAAGVGIAPATSWALITQAPPAPSSDIKVETVASGLAEPWGLQFLPDGRMLVTERPGTIRIVTMDGNKSQPIGGVPKVHAQGQGGLLDIRLAPDFANSGTLFFSFAEPRGGGKSATSVGRAKLVLDGDEAALKDVEIIYRQQPAVRSGRHFGSRIVIDDTGALFVTTGDRGNQSAKAQDAGVSIGKILRITTDGVAAPGNPNLPGWAPEVWSIGHRNIQGAVLSPQTGELWTVEHGAQGGDELNKPQKGGNYGWPTISYGRHYSGGKIGIGTRKVGMEQPVYYWDPSIATSGLEIYTGDLIPEWKGSFLVGGLAGAQLSRLVMENGKVAQEEELLSEQGDRIRDIRQGPDGAVYVLTDDNDGKILRLSPR